MLLHPQSNLKKAEEKRDSFFVRLQFVKGTRNLELLIYIIILWTVQL